LHRSTGCAGVRRHRTCADLALPSPPIRPDGISARDIGLINAVTRTAEDAKSYDRATELEMAGAIVLDLKPTEWRELALAA
jgi:hypothetical protein